MDDDGVAASHSRVGRGEHAALEDALLGQSEALRRELSAEGRDSGPCGDRVQLNNQLVDLRSGSSALAMVLPPTSQIGLPSCCLSSRTLLTGSLATNRTRGASAFSGMLRENT